MTVFKRGDGVVFVREATDYVIGRPSVKRDDIRVCRVTSVTRDGQIKAFVDLSWSSETPVKLANTTYRYATAYILPADEIDIAGVATYCAARPWSHDPRHVGMPFGSLDEVKQELRQFKH
jgi:hypothetical protein